MNKGSLQVFGAENKAMSLPAGVNVLLFPNTLLRCYFYSQITFIFSNISRACTITVQKQSSSSKVIRFASQKLNYSGNPRSKRHTWTRSTALHITELEASGL